MRAGDAQLSTGHAIIASIGDHTQIGLPDLSDVITEVDMEADPADVVPCGFLKEGVKKYSISPIDGSCKVSMGYAECSGVVVVGVDRLSGCNVSFLSHQNPNFFQWVNDDTFEESLRIRLEEMRDCCMPGTIDALIFGGRYVNAKGFPENHEISLLFRREYASAMLMLSGHIQSILGFSPFALGPKFEECFEYAAFNTAARRLYVARQHSDPRFVPSYLAAEVETVRTGWIPGSWSVPGID